MEENIKDIYSSCWCCEGTHWLCHAGHLEDSAVALRAASAGEEGQAASVSPGKIGSLSGWHQHLQLGKAPAMKVTFTLGWFLTTTSSSGAEPVKENQETQLPWSTGRDPCCWPNYLQWYYRLTNFQCWLSSLQNTSHTQFKTFPLIEMAIHLFLPYSVWTFLYWGNFRQTVGGKSGIYGRVLPKL